VSKSVLCTCLFVCLFRPVCLRICLCVCVSVHTSVGPSEAGSSWACLYWWSCCYSSAPRQTAAWSTSCLYVLDSSRVFVI